MILSNHNHEQNNRLSRNLRHAVFTGSLTGTRKLCLVADTDVCGNDFYLPSYPAFNHRKDFV